jgi:hypothetical protein
VTRVRSQSTSAALDWPRLRLATQWAMGVPVGRAQGTFLRRNDEGRMRFGDRELRHCQRSGCRRSKEEKEWATGPRRPADVGFAVLGPFSRHREPIQFLLQGYVVAARKSYARRAVTASCSGNHDDHARRTRASVVLVSSEG